MQLARDRGRNRITPLKINTEPTYDQDQNGPTEVNSPYIIHSAQKLFSQSMASTPGSDELNHAYLIGPALI